MAQTEKAIEYGVQALREVLRRGPQWIGVSSEERSSRLLLDGEEGTALAQEVFGDEIYAASLPLGDDLMADRLKRLQGAYAYATSQVPATPVSQGTHKILAVAIWDHEQVFESYRISDDGARDEAERVIAAARVLLPV